MTNRPTIRKYVIRTLVGFGFLSLLIWGWPKWVSYVTPEGKSKYQESPELRRQQAAMVAHLKAACEGKKEDVAAKAKEFCRINDIPCGNDMSFTSSGGLAGVFQTRRWKPIGSSWENSYREGTIPIKFSRPGKEKLAHPDIFFTYDCQNSDIVEFGNSAVHEEYISKYGGRVRREAKWPAFLPEKEATRIIEGIAAKLALPKDMVFDGIARKNEMGLWTAYWIRKKDGFRYEDDWAGVAIMGATGEFVAFSKQYRMGPCPTVVNIKRDEALSRAKSMLQEKLSQTARMSIGNIGDVYEADMEALIIQADRFKVPGAPLFEPLMKENSRLSWVIRLHFTGGLKHLVDKSPYETEWTEAEDKLSRKYIEEMTFRWGQMGYPPQHYEVRIDATTGDVIYESSL